MSSSFRALLVLNVLYCVLAMTDDRLPGWKMFASVERLDYSLRDRDGRALDVRDYLPRGAYIVDYQELASIATFICEKDRARAPLTFDERGRNVHLVIGPENCRIVAAR